MIAFANENKIPVEASATKPYSMDRNLLHISFEAACSKTRGSTRARQNARLYKFSVAPEDAPNEPEYVELDSRTAIALEVNGKTLSPLGVMQTLNKLGGKHGIGRVDMVENRFVGMKSRGVYETPGGAILHFAHRQMETLTMDREVMHLRDRLIPKYTRWFTTAYWFAPEREALQHW